MSALNSPVKALVSRTENFWRLLPLSQVKSAKAYGSLAAGCESATACVTGVAATDWAEMAGAAIRSRVSIGGVRVVFFIVAACRAGYWCEPDPVRRVSSKSLSWCFSVSRPELDGETHYPARG